jgi:type IV pilus assembly protein PilN
MRITVNLATRPFVELRPVLMRLRLIMAGLGLASAALWIGGAALSAKLARQNALLDRLRNQTIAVQAARVRTEARLRQGNDAAILERAHFLNALFLRKSFSWTAVMMDLEQVLPGGVQVTSIEPQVGADGTVVIRMRVAGERDRAVELVRNLERSRRFLQPRLASESSQTKENGNTQAAQVNPAAPAAVDFDILANYNPLPEGEAYPKPKVVAASPEPTGPAVIMGTPVAPETARRFGMRPQGAGNQGVGNGKYPPGGVVLKPFAGQPAANAPGGPQR